MNKLLIATTNPGKLAEFKEFLSDLPLKLIGLVDVGIVQKAPENGTTFKENALMKAKIYAKLSGLPTLADDGGFEIDALGGEPGVKSHRWISGDHEDSDEDIIAYVFTRMKDIPEGKRNAQMRLTLALVLPDGKEFFADGIVKGIVPFASAKVPANGFPFRSVLYLPEIGKFYNQHELTEAENNRYNHRKQALSKLMPIIKKYLC